MIWSLTKVLVFVAMIAALAMGAGFLMETSGGITVEFGAIGFKLTPLLTAIGLLLLVFAVWVLLKVFGLLFAVLRFINGDNTAISRYFERNRERRGVDALSEGLIALARGDSASALYNAQKAGKLLKKHDVANLLIAQAAEQSGDVQTAEETYKKLLEDKKTRFVGVRGLLQQKLASGDTDMALKLAEKAFALDPKHEETQNSLLKLQTDAEDWSGARKTLAEKLRQGALPRDVHRRRDAVMALAKARMEREAGRLESAHELAIDANRLSPDLIPATVLVARGYVEQGYEKYATKVIQSAWNAMPHPDLAAAFANIAPDEDIEARIKRFTGLVKKTAHTPESRMVMAELHIANTDYAAARLALGDLVDTAPTMRSVTILAAIERGECASDDVIRALLTKAITAQRDPAWICEICGEVHISWEPVCFNCDAFDTLVWKTPPASTQSAETTILPMIAAATPQPDVIPDLNMTDVELIVDQSGDVEDIKA